MVFVVEYEICTPKQFTKNNLEYQNMYTQAPSVRGHFHYTEFCLEKGKGKCVTLIGCK